MNYTSGIDQETGAFSIKIRVLIDTRLICEAIEGLIARSDWRDGSHIIVDHRNSVSLRLTSSDLARMADLMQRQRVRLDGTRIALLMREGSQFGMARMWQMAVPRKASFEARIFLHETEARRWIRDADAQRRRAEAEAE